MSTSSTRPRARASAVDDRDAVARVLDLDEQVAGDEHGAPFGPRRRSSSRISRIPAGSRPFAGSSRTSNAGSFSNAAARPSRCRMPSEYLPHLVVTAFGEPDRARAPRRHARGPMRSIAPSSAGSRDRSSSGTTRASRRSRRRAASRRRGRSGTGRPRRRTAPAVGRPGRAGSGWSSSCPNRSARGSRTRRLREPRGRAVRPRRRFPRSRRYSLRSPSISITGVMHRQTNSQAAAGNIQENSSRSPTTTLRASVQARGRPSRSVG